MEIFIRTLLSLPRFSSVILRHMCDMHMSEINVEHHGHDM